MHSRLLFTLLLVLGGLTLWGGLRYLLGHGPSEVYRAVAAIGELLLISELLIGLGLWALGYQPARLAVHLIYALVAVLTLPGAALYLRGRDPRSAQLVYTLTCLFLCGIVLRALETGRGP
ncbi:MAG: hypothetical protein OHK0022_43740 [Roseiflexaceae bacterium]